MDDGTPLPRDLYHLPGFHEPFSAMSHLLGAVVFAFLGYGLLVRGWGNPARVTYLSIYAFACVFLFSMSGVYHMMTRGGVAHDVLARLDHGAIFVLIAGSFTPAHGLLFTGWLRWAPLIGVWTAAITGVTLKSIFFHDFPDWLGLSLYLALGWFGAFSGILLARRFGFAFIAPLLWGGIAYSIGGILEFTGGFWIIPRVVHPHEVFHLAVLVGAVFHWYFVWQFADGRLPAMGIATREQSERGV